MTTHDVLTGFIEDVKQILGEEGPTDRGLKQIADRMQELVSSGEAAGENDDEAGNVHAGRQSKPLYTDESGLTLVRARFGPEKMTPIHNHGCWGVVGVYGGRDHYQAYSRLDGGFGPGEARLELVEDSVLGPGDVKIIPPPPHDIHAQQGHEESCYELVLFGQNAMVNSRLYFDLETDTAQEVAPRGAN